MLIVKRMLKQIMDHLPWRPTPTDRSGAPSGASDLHPCSFIYGNHSHPDHSSAVIHQPSGRRLIALAPVPERGGKFLTRRLENYLHARDFSLGFLGFFPGMISYSALSAALAARIYGLNICSFTAGREVQTVFM
jgi:hypothetical protein